MRWSRDKNPESFQEKHIEKVQGEKEQQEGDISLELRRVDLVATPTAFPPC